MLERIVSDILVRVLGSYVEGLNKESIRVGIWRGDMELHHLRLRPEALAVLFETLGLDLPVTVTAGYIGLLRLEVPWKSLRSAPVRIFMHDVTIVASPVSDGDQTALEERDRRLKAARLATDEALRDAKFSVRSVKKAEVNSSEADPQDPAAESGNAVSRWGWRFTSRFVTKIVDNIQIDVENVIVQYEDASSVRDCPYTATLAFDSLQACSTDHQWNPVFIESPTSPVVHKVVYMRGLVLNWQPGNANNDIKSWILDPEAERSPGKWSGFVRECLRHAIRPLDGELRIALTKSSAITAAVAGKNPALRYLKSVPRVQLDLHFPDVNIALDGFQYHTLLSTIMYLSDIDRKVRPKTARGRWFWALERLLPRFKERRMAALSFNAEGLRKRRETREDYCRARNAVVTARRKGTTEPKKETEIVTNLERELSYDDVMMFRDIADDLLYKSVSNDTAPTAVGSRIWSIFSRGTAIMPRSPARGGSDTSTPRRSRSRSRSPSRRSSPQRDGSPGSNFVTSDSLWEAEPSASANRLAGESFDESMEDIEDGSVPNFRMGFLLERGAIELKEGGQFAPPTPVASLEFKELRLGIATRPGTGLLLEALLGTFEVVDLQKHMKVMYPRAPWAGQTTVQNSYAMSASPSSDPPVNILTQFADKLKEDKLSSTETVSTSSGKSSSQSSQSQCAILHSYPREISNAIAEIRGEYGVGSTPMPQVSTPYSLHNSREASVAGGSSTASLSGLSSDGALSGVSMQNREDLSIAPSTPLRYVAALRLNHEEVPEGEWAKGATRMAMDLAIGGMEVLVDGPHSAFISSITFWHPKEKMPSIMHFLTRAAAPRLASLRMDLQKAVLERSVPMRMDLLIRAPRFIFPGPVESDVSLLLDLGTFAMETSTGPPKSVYLDEHQMSNKAANSSQSPLNPISIRYTDYKMAATDLGLYVVAEGGRQAAERVIRPFSVHLLLKVLHNSSFLEAITLSYGKVDIAKVKLVGQLPSMRTSISHDAFRHVLEIVTVWGDNSRKPIAASGIEPNKAANSVTVAADLEEVRYTKEMEEVRRRESVKHLSPLVAFEMALDFEELQLELRDSKSRRIVTITTSGTGVKLKRRRELVDFDFRLRTFYVQDGSRGATAPFRRLAFAGVERRSSVPFHADMEREMEDSFGSSDRRAFISLSYRADKINNEQSLGIRVLSLHLVCVRETYFALADFFYLKEMKQQPPIDNLSSPQSSSYLNQYDADDAIGKDSVNKEDASAEGTAEYTDPFAALGMTTSGAARALRAHAGRGMVLSKQALANRGKLSLKANLDGMDVTLVTAEGAIACFDVTDCVVNLSHFSNGAVIASGELGGFGIRDLTSAYDVYSETIRYNRKQSSNESQSTLESDGWTLRIPGTEGGDMWLEARLRNLKLVYLQRFVVILKKYFDVLRESLRPVLEMEGGIGEVFAEEQDEDLMSILAGTGRIRLNVITEDVDVVMPRHSQSPYEALRFLVATSSITNEDRAAPGYQIGIQLKAEGVNAHVLYEPPAKGEGRALTPGGKEPVLKQIAPQCPVNELCPFSENICIVAKMDTWRRRRVPEVVLNADGIPVLKDGQEEKEYDPTKWLPAIRIRISAPHGISARLCEAEYSILYFTFTENVIERPDIEFTDIVRGLKTPVLPARKPVQPIMFSSNRMPPNYQILFEVPNVDSVIMSGADPRDKGANLIRTQLRHVVGCFEYGVDYRMTIEVNANMHSLKDARPNSNTRGIALIVPAREYSDDVSPHGDQTKRSPTSDSGDSNRSVALTWDRPFGFRTNVMVVVSDLRIIVEPELFRDLGSLTAPGYPFLKSSAPPPLIRFNGRLLLLTVSRPEIWLMAKQYPGDGRSLVLRGNVIAKVRWAPVTGRNTVEIAANGIRVNLSATGPFFRPPVSPHVAIGNQRRDLYINKTETPMLYPSDIVMKFEGRGYDPPESPDGKPIKAPGSNLHVNAESFLVRVDVNDTPLILAVASGLAQLKPSMLSKRPEQPGRFDEWIDKDEDGDSKLTVHFSLPQSRLMFTDETAGRYVPIMEARLRNTVVRSNVPWLTNAAFEFALDLFNDEKGWWEPGIEAFPIEIAASQGRSGSRAVHVRAEKIIDVNVTPNTVSGAARVSKALKSAIEDLLARLVREKTLEGEHGEHWHPLKPLYPSAPPPEARRPSVAAFCVRNETGRPVSMWLPYDSKKVSLLGNGGEYEVDTPSEELLWTAISSVGSPTSDPSSSRRVSMTCVLSFSGYEAVSLSTEQTGTNLISFAPDLKDVGSASGSHRAPLAPITLVWDVTMRDGVPCGCIRSLLRLINHTQILLEVNVEGLTKSPGSLSDIGTDIRSGHGDIEREAHGLIEPGASWSIPVHAIDRAVRIRPALLKAPSSEDDIIDALQDAKPSKGRVYYRYKWSDPLSKISSLQEAGEKLLQTSKRKRVEGSSHNSIDSIVHAPVLTCTGADSRRVFCMSIEPRLESGSAPQSSPKSWVDVHVNAPVVLENLLPRPISFKLASFSPSNYGKSGQIFAEGYIEPSRERHIHGIGSDLENVALALGIDNTPESSSVSGRTGRSSSRAVGEFRLKLPEIERIPARIGKTVTFPINLAHEQSLTTRKIGFYCEYWIRNRCDTDLFFIDRHSLRDPYSSGSKVFLRGKAPGTKADKFICFSGRWLSLQRADRNEDVWVNVSTEVNEIDKPLHVNFEGLSLLINVRPAKGRFQRALVVTVLNAVWLENRTDSILQWCQPAAMKKKGIALSSNVHEVCPKACVSVHWDYKSEKKAICFRRAEEDGSSDWIWSRAVGVEGLEGEFAAKMYRPKRHEQYIARVVISKLGGGVSAVVVHPEDRSTPPYRIVNRCATRSVAFRQTGVNETHPWLVRPGRTTRYSWDDPQAPVKSRSLVVEVIEGLPDSSDTSSNRSKLGSPDSADEHSNVDPSESNKPPSRKEIRYPKFELNIDMIGEDVPFSHSTRFDPELVVSVQVKGPTKVVTFVDKVTDEGVSPESTAEIYSNAVDTLGLQSPSTSPQKFKGDLDVEVFINALGISFVESKPVELAYLSVTGMHFRLDRYDGQQLLVCEVQDVQLDNQLTHCTWPVVLWSPPILESSTSSQRSASSGSKNKKFTRKPFFQLTVKGLHPSMNQGIGTFRGIFVALQQLQIAADEDFVLRVWLFVMSLIEAAGGSNKDKDEVLRGNDGWESGLPIEKSESAPSDTVRGSGSTLMNRLYVEHLELCPLKFTVSFTSSRTSSAAEQIGGFRSLIRTLVAVLGNVENAEFRFNALQLDHVFDTTSHFRSLIVEYYISQGSNQKMVLLASNSLIGNPSQLFDSIAIGTRDFFVEPANAKGSADFIASIGRGSSSLLTNTVGGLVGSLGGIPRAVAQGLETAVGDREYLAERDSIRGGRARIVSSPAQGLLTGALSFGHGIASGAAGLLRDPIHGAAEEGPSGFIKGLGKGFIGGVLKPITGALDLIAEPAAGFRSMMVSDSKSGLAEPTRPPRAFWGVQNDRMVTYDLHASLGQTILALINHRDGDSDERLLSWTHLVSVGSTASQHGVVSFLWELLRRTKKSSHFQPSYLRDAQGNPQKAEKIRVGLITNKRLIISLLDGHVIRDFLLDDIVDTKVSKELNSRHLLSVGVRSGRFKLPNLAPSWTKIHCGSLSSRDELNASLKKTLKDMKLVPGSSVRKVSKEFGSSRKEIAMQEVRRDPTADRSVEMMDMSQFTDVVGEQENMTELKVVHHDASADGRRGIFTSMKLPGREGKGGINNKTTVGSSRDFSMKHEINKVMESPSMRHANAIRSVRIVLANATGMQLRLVHSTMESGVWAKRPPAWLDVNGICAIEADGGENRVLDVCGILTMAIVTEGETTVDESAENCFVIRFLNPLLAANAYAMHSPTGFTACRSGGEKGDHVCCVMKLKASAAVSTGLKEEWKSARSAAEPLLFGRSKVSPYLPPINYRPPHAPEPDRMDPTDPSLVENITSLGFGREEAEMALRECEGDVAGAYAKLMERKGI